MRSLPKFSVLLLLLLVACAFSGSERMASEPTLVPDRSPIAPSDTPAQDEAYTECAFVWARQKLADLSTEFEATLKATLPQASGYAEAYGENCITNQGEVARFQAMETDFYVTVPVENLDDTQALGETVEQVLGVLRQFPVEVTPGPQSGYVGIDFEAPTDAVRLWFRVEDAESAMQQGLHGTELFNALKAK